MDFQKKVSHQKAANPSFHTLGNVFLNRKAGWFRPLSKPWPDFEKTFCISAKKITEHEKHFLKGKHKHHSHSHTNKWKHQAPFWRWRWVTAVVVKYSSCSCVRSFSTNLFFEWETKYLCLRPVTQCRITGRSKTPSASFSHCLRDGALLRNEGWGEKGLAGGSFGGRVWRKRSKESWKQG